MRIYKGHGIVWNPETDRQLAEFVEGKFEASDEQAYDILDSIGLKYDEVPDPEPKVEQNAGPESFEEMTLEEVKQFADENGIDIGKATTKAGIIEKIKAVLG